MTILSSWTVCSLWSIISTNHMTPLCDHPVIHSALTNKHAAAWKERRAGLWENAVLQDISGGEALAQLAQLSSVEEKIKQEVQNGTCDIFVHLRNFLLRFGFCLYRECFAMEKKKNNTYGNSLKIGGIFFIFSFFSVLIVIVHACLSREGVRHSFWNGKEATVAV